ncbi:hypothetical protein J2X20_004074 [Pelomonas saccharophila]|uniref:DUF1440 domain-containing protein n=1 Tax=Roseateles saccharophilus TaxID=304 RepID=A0ABU1YTW7_ROSSA|nr:hypothetical protein [Roseateles saccharophilus]MDR7271406.1 hypothetical protein [Roseateles saccharophilus]
MRRIQTVILAGLVSGALDILAAFASYASQGATAEGILKYIASGLLGAAAMQGGMGTAGLGLLFHFLLTTGMAAVFLLAALKLPALTLRPWLWGALYGVLTWVAMVYIVVPLSGVTGWKLPQGWNIVSGLLSHIFYVGVPIAHITQYGLRGRPRFD